MSERREPTPVALYARVSSDRQDVDLSISAQLRALRDYARKNGYIAARPEFRKMIDEARLPEAAFEEVLIRQTQ